MASKYPGKKCNKKTADMTPEELEQNRAYCRAVAASRYIPVSTPIVSKYPGKHCKKKVADMTSEEYAQNMVYIKASRGKYRAAIKQDESFKRKHRESAARYRKMNPDKILSDAIKRRKLIVMDPIKHAAHLFKRNLINKQCIRVMDSVYIKKNITMCTGLPASIISDEMVIMYRATLAIKRVVRDLNNEEVS